MCTRSRSKILADSRVKGYRIHGPTRLACPNCRQMPIDGETCCEDLGHREQREREERIRLGYLVEDGSDADAGGQRPRAIAGPSSMWAAGGAAGPSGTAPVRGPSGRMNTGRRSAEATAESAVGLVLPVHPSAARRLLLGSNHKIKGNSRNGSSSRHLCSQRRRRKTAHTP